MYDGILHPVQCVEGPADDMLARLRQHLHRHIIRNEIILHEAAQKLVLRLRGRRKADLDLLESHAHEKVEEGQLLIETHRDDEGLVAVTQIDRAPDGCFLGRILTQPVQTDLRRHIVPLGIFLVIHHRSPRIDIP